MDNTCERLCNASWVDRGTSPPLNASLCAFCVDAMPTLAHGPQFNTTMVDSDGLMHKDEDEQEVETVVVECR